MARALAISAVLSLGACGEDEEEIVVHPGEQTEAFCEAVCARGAECGGREMGPCQQDCEAQSTLEDLRPDFVQELVDCYMDLSCGRVFAQEGFDACWNRAVERTRPNEQTRRFCFGFATRDFECGSSYPTEECEEDWKIFSKVFLDPLTACESLECAEFNACVDAALGDT